MNKKTRQNKTIIIIIMIIIAIIIIKLWNMKVTVVPIIVGAFEKETGGNRNQRKNRNHIDHGIIVIG